MIISVYQNIQKLPYTFTNTIADNIMHIYFLYKNKSINKDIYIYIYIGFGTGIGSGGFVRVGFEWEISGMGFEEFVGVG